MTRWLIILVALAGVVIASLALREHYRTGTSPCSINDNWDCGIVNHSPYAVFAGVPVAIIGIAGYLLLAGLALRKAWWLLLLSAVGGLVFSLYLTRIEWKVIQVWCIYCVINVFTILLLTLLALLQSWLHRRTQPSPAS
jgi:vitamin-K-epoxide reductase (warfarin-sensitive)